MTDFSVIIPTRNRHRFLKQAVESVLAQDRKEVEIIVVDDGSGASDCVGSMGRNVVVLDNQSRGPVPARKMGVEAATSDCIAFLDDDDWWTDTNYLSMAAQMFDGGADFCFGDGIMVFEDERDDLPYSFKADANSLMRDNTILISAVTYRRSLHATLGGFDALLPYYWDWDWYLRVARAGHRMAHLAVPVVAIRVHNKNMSGQSTESQRRSNLDLFSMKHALPFLPLKNHLDIAQHSPGTPPLVVKDV